MLIKLQKQANKKEGKYYAKKFREIRIEEPVSLSALRCLLNIIDQCI